MERRRHPRGKSLYGGIIAFNNRQSTLSCVIRNFSTAGAKIALNQTVLLPNEFDLSVARKEKSFRARLVWRNELEAGLQLIDNVRSDVVSLEVARMMRTRKAENEMLRQRVTELSGE